MMGHKRGWVVGLLLVGCAREAAPEKPLTEPERDGPVLGQSCALSSPPRASASPPRIFVELASLEGDWAAIQATDPATGQNAGAPRSFPQVLTDPRWNAISVRHVIANDGARQTFPWEFEPPPASADCPPSERWEISLAPHVTGRSPVTVRLELQILPAPPPGTAPDTFQVPASCGARTTLVLRDQQLIALSGFPTSANANANLGLMTTVTPYVIWEDADLERLIECKRRPVAT